MRPGRFRVSPKLLQAGDGLGLGAVGIGAHLSDVGDAVLIWLHLGGGDWKLRDIDGEIGAGIVAVEDVEKSSANGSISQRSWILNGRVTCRSVLDVRGAAKFVEAGIGSIYPNAPEKKLSAVVMVTLGGHSHSGRWRSHRNRLGDEWCQLAQNGGERLRRKGRSHPVRMHPIVPPAARSAACKRRPHSRRVRRAGIPTSAPSRTDNSPPG